ncbi:MAG: hypothetical protein WEC37_03340 [Anaerolineales bacterium]
MTGMLRIILIGAVLLHGLGHFLFAAPLWGISGNWGQSTRSWLLGAGSIARISGSLIFVAAMLGFVAAAWGMYAGLEWWRTVAIIASLVSLIGIILFWSSPIPAGVLPASAFNISILVSSLLVRWPDIDQLVRS